jgi:hypothetical protein
MREILGRFGVFISPLASGGIHEHQTPFVRDKPNQRKTMSSPTKFQVRGLCEDAIAYTCIHLALVAHDHRYLDKTGNRLLQNRPRRQSLNRRVSFFFDAYSNSKKLISTDYPSETFATAPFFR